MSTLSLTKVTPSWLDLPINAKGVQDLVWVKESASFEAVGVLGLICRDLLAASPQAKGYTLSLIAHDVPGKPLRFIARLVRGRGEAAKFIRMRVTQRFFKSVWLMHEEGRGHLLNRAIGSIEIHVGPSAFCPNKVAVHAKLDAERKAKAAASASEKAAASKAESDAVLNAHGEQDEEFES